MTTTAASLASEKRALLARLDEIRSLEQRHPLLTDRRIDDLRDDRTGNLIRFGGGDVDPLHHEEAMSLLDEVAAWRVHRLTDAEKEALRELAQWVSEVDASAKRFEKAVAAIRRIAPRK